LKPRARNSNGGKDPVTEITFLFSAPEKVINQYTEWQRKKKKKPKELWVDSEKKEKKGFSWAQEGGNSINTGVF